MRHLKCSTDEKSKDLAQIWTHKLHSRVESFDICNLQVETDTIPSRLLFLAESNLPAKIFWNRLHNLFSSFSSLTFSSGVNVCISTRL